MPKRTDLKKYWLSDPDRLLSDRPQNLTMPVRRHVSLLKKKDMK